MTTRLPPPAPHLTLLISHSQNNHPMNIDTFSFSVLPFRLFSVHNILRSRTQILYVCVRMKRLDSSTAGSFLHFDSPELHCSGCFSLSHAHTHRSTVHVKQIFPPTHSLTNHLCMRWSKILGHIRLDQFAK